MTKVQYSSFTFKFEHNYDFMQIGRNPVDIADTAKVVTEELK